MEGGAINNKIMDINEIDDTARGVAEEIIDKHCSEMDWNKQLDFAEDIYRLICNDAYYKLAKSTKK